MAVQSYTSAVPLYEQIATDLSKEVDLGIFRPGERIPSVRNLSQQRGVSVTTIMQAYQLLEARGLIEARPQSGYYVRNRRLSPLPEMDLSQPPADPRAVTIDALALMVIRDTLNPKLVQFGTAMPHPDLLPTARLHRLIAEAARRGHPLQTVCGVPEGCEEIRLQIAQRAYLTGASISPDDLIITSGALEGVNLALRAVCRPGDTVAIESPAYFGILQALESQGLRALEIPTHPRDGMSLEALGFALENHSVRAVLSVTNFSNPLGSVMPDDHKRHLVEMLAERDIPLIEDDIFGELYFSSQRPKVAKAFDQKGLVLLASSFSKDLSPSFRVGWLAPGRYKTTVDRLKMATNLGTALLPQLAVAEFIASGAYERHLRRIRRAYAQKMSAMADAILRYFPQGTCVTNPSGGFTLWVRLPEQVDSLELYRLGLQAGITIAPGILFSVTPKYNNYIRLTAGYYSERTDAAVQRLGELVLKLLQ